MMTRDMLGAYCEKRHDISTTSAMTRRSTKRPLILLLPTVVVLLAAGCSSDPLIETDVPGPGSFHEHALTNGDEHLGVTVAVLSNDEAEAKLGLDLSTRWLQAIWIEAENRDDVPYWLLMPSLDPNYFAPDEVAYTLRGTRSDQELYELMRRIRALAFRNPIAPRSVVSGFVFVSMDLDHKQIDLQLLSSKRVEEFAFFLPVRGLVADTLFRAGRWLPNTIPPKISAMIRISAMVYAP